ncbi:WD-repeat protein [Microcystis aeruginosa NIES-3804]|uniref:WD-repeat protein n=1 Tax=Microcystis aeruginosa NIES-3804 TaxID=2517783 RepID=A0A6H9GW40_MICAE|nr:AAA-like domain-containing protein [Microcystis aeruginosa]GCL50202.1 WD-repeat protein [Microcystis aeruginosa NIES-3804]
MIKNFYKYGGKLHAHTPSYVKRFADGQLYELLKQNYFCYVFNCRQMGKSSLQAQVKMRLEATNAQVNQCVYLSLQEMDVSQSSSENQWYRELSKKIFGELNLDKQADFKGCWSRFSGQGAVSSFSDFIVEVLLPLTSSNLVIFIDEIDKILELSFRDNFFGLIRAFHEKRAEYDDFNRLTFCFLGVATPNDLIQNPLQSPFNIGRAIELRGFEFNESLVLAQGLQDVASVPEEVLREILFWTGGQPFLTQKVCALLVESQVRIGEGQEKSFIEEFIYSSIIRNWEGQDDPSHLKDIKNRLLAKEILTGKLLEIYRHILQNGYFTTEGNQLESELRLSGLVVKRNADLEIFNPIYREVFSLEWVQKQLDNLRPYAVALNAWLASEKNNVYLLDDTETARADIWREGKFLTREDEEFIRDSKLAQKDKESAQKIEAEREAKKILEKAKKKAQKALIGSIIASALIIAVTLIFAIIQTTKAEKASQEANKSMQNLTNIKKERDKIGQEVIRANDRLSQVSAERRQIELNARQRLAVAQGNLKRLETARNQAQQQVTQFQRQKTILEQERQIILTQKQKAESRNQKSQDELQKIEHNLKVNRQKLEESVRSLQRAEQLRQLAIKGTQLEQEGTNIFRRFLSDTEDQIALLIESMKIAQELKQLVGNNSLDKYPAISPLNTLHNILDYSREKNRFGGIIYTYKFVVIPNHQHLAFISTFGDTTAIIDLKGNVITRLKSESGKDSVREVSFSSKGQILATVAMDNTTRILDFDGKLLAEFKVFEEVLTNSYGLFFSPVLSMVFSPDAKLLATGMRNNTIRLWDIKGNLIKEFKGHEGGVNSVAFSPNGQFIASGADDNTVRLWDIKGNLIKEFKGHQQSVKSVIFSPNGQFIASGANDNTVRLWDLKGNLIEEFKGHEGGVNSVVFSPNGQFIASGADDKMVRLWDLKGNLIEKFKGHEQSVKSVAFSLDGLSIFSSSDDKTVRVWDLQSSFIREFKEHWPNVRSITFNRDGNLIATASENQAGRVWDLQGNLIVKLEGHQDWVTSIAFSPDSQFLFTSSWDKKIRIWNRQGGLIREFKAYDDYINDMVLSPNGKFIATVPMGDTVKLWDIEGNLLKQFKFKKSIFLTINFSHNSKLLAMGLSREVGRLEGIQGKDLVLAVVLDLDGNIVTKLKGHKKDVRSVAFSPDDQLLATASEDGTTRVWDIKGNLIRELKGHEGSVNSVVFSPDGQLIATGSNDRTIRLWDLKGNLVREFMGHRGGVSTIAFSPDGKYLVSGASDGTARLWRVEGIDELLTRGCYRLSDYFVSHPQDLQELPVCQQALKTSR